MLCCSPQASPHPMHMKSTPYMNFKQ
jgi:hypothetical protein